MKKIKLYLSSLLLLAIFSGCQKEEIMSFQAPDAVNFGRMTNLYSVQYSFLTNPQAEFIQAIPVSIIGNPADHDRNFKVEVVKDSITTASAAQYEIVGGTVKAGEHQGTLLIKLLNSTVLNTSMVSLKLKLVDSEDFKAGNVESREFVVSWTNKVIVPVWGVYLRTFITAKGSTLAFRLFMQISGLTQFTAKEYIALGAAGTEALGTRYGDYIMQWNKDHPDNILKHDDGTSAGQPIVPIYYTRSKF